MQTYTKRVDGKTEVVMKLKRTEVAALARCAEVMLDIYRVGDGGAKMQANDGYKVIAGLMLALGEGDSLPARDNS